jgi:hypothetical protein
VYDFSRSENDIYFGMEGARITSPDAPM